MKKYISIGKFRKSFIYIILSVVFLILKDSLYGFNYLNSLKDIRIFNSNTQILFSRHILIHNTFNYFGAIIIAFFFHRYEKKSSENENNLLLSRTSSNKSSNIILIHKRNDKDFTTKKSFIIFLFILFWIIEELSIELYTYILKDLDFWMLELLIITLFHKKMFKIEIYIHQKMAILINIIPCLLKIIAIILGFHNDLSKYNILYKIKPLLIPIGIILFFILITLRSYINSKIKWYMDLKYISPNKLLMYYGTIGTLISLIICIISTFNKCIIKNETSFTNYICRIVSNEDQYIENFSIFRNFS